MMRALCGVGGRFYIRRRRFRALHFGFKVAIGATLLLYLFIPFLFHFSASVQRHLVFLPFVRWPKGVDFGEPQTEGLLGARNLYLQTEPGISVGVWHILPKSYVEDSVGKKDDYWERLLRESGKPIILYLHGNSGSRAGEHRKELYLILQAMNFHLICFDYRGYADSSQVSPSETGVVADAKAVFDYVKKVVGDTKRIFIWGHSLGTGVSSHMVADLCVESNKPAGLILESPFTSIGEEVKHHMLSALYRYLPGFDYIFVKPLHKNDIAFQSDVHIAKIDIPIVILHAVDDPVVPFFLGVKLYSIAKKSRDIQSKPVYFKSFGEGYAHKFICRAPNLPQLMMDFVHCSLKDSWPCKGFDNPEFVFDE